MATTLTMPENLDAVASEGEAEGELEIRIHEPASEANEANELDNLDDLPGQAIETAPEGFISPADDAATTPETSCSLVDDASQTPVAEPPVALPAAPAATPVARLSPTDDFLIQLQNAERECRRTESIVTDLKEQLKDAKTDYDSAVNKLRELASNVAEMTRNDAERPLLAMAELQVATAESPTVNEPATKNVAADELADQDEPDTSIDWPLNHVPSQIEMIKTAYDLEAATFHDCCLDDPEGVNVEDILLQQGDFRVAAWRDQTDQDVIPDYVLTFRAEQAIAVKSAPLTDAAVDEASWRAYPIELLELSDGTVGALHNAEIETMGALADYTKAGKFLTDIPKIGKAKVEQIENATEKFWASRPDLNQAR